MTTLRRTRSAILVSLVMVGLLTGCGSRDCGDYTRSGSSYTYTPNEGTHDLDNGTYVSAPCRSSGGLGFLYFGGSGSSNRGGGPGFGK